MTQEQDIVERLLDICENDDHKRGCQGREYDCTCGFDERIFATAKEAAQTIAALRARYDKMREDAFTWKGMYLSADKRAEAAEARVDKLVASCSLSDLNERLAIDAMDTAIRERDDYKKNFNDATEEGQRVSLRWREDIDRFDAELKDRSQKYLDTANERDEMRKALEPFAKRAERYASSSDDDEDAATVTVGDLRRARSASSNREGGE